MQWLVTHCVGRPNDHSHWLRVRHEFRDLDGQVDVCTVRR
jgi:hypothetical protein